MEEKIINSKTKRSFLLFGTTFLFLPENNFMNRNKENNRASNIPENNPSRAMDSKHEVDQSPDNKTDQDFPGYPYYPAKEDIMDHRSGSHRVDADLENMGTGPNASGVNQRFLAGNNFERDKEMQQGSVDDNQEGELTAMDSTNAEMGTPQNVSNEDLNADTPGTDLKEEK